MTQKKILLVIGYPLLHNSSVSIQNRVLILGLKKLGFRVDVVCPQSNPLSISYDPSMEDILSLVDNLYEIRLSNIYKYALKILSKDKSINNLENQRTLTTTKSTKNFFVKDILRKLFSQTFDYFELTGGLKLSVKKLNISLNHDLIISSSDPKVAHIIAYKLLKKTENTKWIQYWGDPWYCDIAMKGKWKKPIVYLLERKLIKKADRIIYASPLTLDAQRKLFQKYSYKMAFVNQATEIWDNCDEENLKNTKEITVSYVGDYNSRIRDITPFLKATKYFPNIKFKIVGSGDVKLPVENNVEIIQKRLSLIEIRKIERLTHVFFTMTNKKGTQIPAKIYYLAGYIKKPIIVATDGENKKELVSFFQSFDRYIICENKVNDIREAISKAVNIVQNNVNFEISKKLTPEHMAEKMLETLWK